MRPILTAAETRAAEAEALAAGTSVETLMERAGLAAAEAIWRFAGPMRTLVLCGPGNNGGDGYVAARALAAKGFDVQVASLAGPTTPAAVASRSAWSGPLSSLDGAQPAPLLVDALFGTGLRRPLEPQVVGRVGALAGNARIRVAIDLPSGVSSDDGAILSPVPPFDLTVTFASLKPAHLLEPAAAHMGRIVVADIGLQARSDLTLLERPRLGRPSPSDHKYSRGYVAMFAGEMPGAAALAAGAALRAGAGYIRVIAADWIEGVPAAVVQASDEAGTLRDPRLRCILVGPGLGRGRNARQILDSALTSNLPLVIDGDALNLLAERKGEPPRDLAGAILTPHGGEFARMFPALAGSKLERARSAAAQTGAVVVFKGADTVIASPDGRAAIGKGSPWLATAGTGDVLAGAVAATRSVGLEAYEAACAGAWLHGRAAELAGAGLIADDLVPHLASAFAECI
ncbi:MAG TPA: NAD(P)H-hydrate dehydratase [Allosphingosinicella sp.]|nr:NAD(P)H-hydrate dehydratase [Allosphingosinicella sp.]